MLGPPLLGPLVIRDGAGRAAEIADLAARATQCAVRARGDGTRRAYRSAWAGYVGWCRDLGREPLAGEDPRPMPECIWPPVAYGFIAEYDAAEEEHLVQARTL